VTPSDGDSGFPISVDVIPAGQRDNRLGEITDMVFGTHARTWLWKIAVRLGEHSAKHPVCTLWTSLTCCD
jgi:hypothetical protein